MGAIGRIDSGHEYRQSCDLVATSSHNADTRGRALHTFADGAECVVNVDAAGLSGRGRLGVIVGRSADGVIVAHGKLRRTYSPLRAAWATVDDWQEWQRIFGHAPTRARFKRAAGGSGPVAIAAYLAVARSRSRHCRA